MTDPTPPSLEPIVGVHGLRTFRVALDGNLLPLTQLSNDWAGGRCVARCAVRGRRRPQSPRNRLHLRDPQLP